MKTVCTPGLPGNPNQQRKRYTPHRGHLRGPRADFALPACPGPSSTLRKTSAMTPDGGVPFSLLVGIPWEARGAHRFHRKSPKMAQNHLKRGKPPFLHVFYLVPLQVFSWCWPEPQKWCFFNPNMGTGLKNTTLGLVLALRKKL